MGRERVPAEEINTHYDVLSATAKRYNINLNAVARHWTKHNMMTMDDHTRSEVFWNAYVQEQTPVYEDPPRDRTRSTVIGKNVERTLLFRKWARRYMWNYHSSECLPIFG